MPKDNEISKDDVSQIADFDSKKKKDKNVDGDEKEEKVMKGEKYGELDKNSKKPYFEKKKKEEPEDNDDESEYDDVDEENIPEDKKPKFDFSKLKKKDK